MNRRGFLRGALAALVPLPVVLPLMPGTFYGAKVAKEAAPAFTIYVLEDDDDDFDYAPADTSEAP